MAEADQGRKGQLKHVAAAVVLAGGVALELTSPGALGIVLVVTACVFEMVVSIALERGMSRLGEFFARVSKGDRPSQQILPKAIRHAALELQTLVRDVEARLEAGDATYKNLKEHCTAVFSSIERISQSFADQQEMLAKSNRAIGVLSESLSLITSHVDALTTAAEESSSSILQMTMTNEEVAENMTVMSASVRDTVSSIDQMAHSIRESADNIDGLSAAAEETSSSMTEIDRSVDQVQTNANETAKIISDVAVDAERGADAIAKTLETINRIKDSSQEAVNVISNLGQKIGAIGHILNVIDDVAEQTNLLALNAAIIAAQAGEHGKGFAVVADEIKELSERSGVSTKEIADLIKSIQAESRNAIEAVEQGNARVDEGVKVSAQAEQALMQILQIAKKATEMMNSIARATVEQSYGSKQVTDAISRIAENVQQIAAATAEQARGSELIISGAETMRSITQHVERSTAEQANGGRQITMSIESISKKIKHLSMTHNQQQEEINGLLELSKHVEQLTGEQDKLLSEVRSTFRTIEDSFSTIISK
jgi:methyl-accepting chemotaxis protein